MFVDVVVEIILFSGETTMLFVCVCVVSVCIAWEILVYECSFRHVGSCINQ